MFIIPEEVLNNLICSVCSKYLSVKPVKVYGSSIKCGRCSENNDEGAVSIYNNIITNSLFPCVNRYEGCNHLLNYSEVPVHEKVCASRTYKCPICFLDIELTSYELLQHYKSTHINEILEKPEIVINGEKEFENYYMYKENNFLFIVYLRCDVSENCFLFNVACLGPKERVERIQQYIQCYLNDEIDFLRLFFQTKKRSCTILENNADPFKISFPSKKKVFILKFYLEQCGIYNFNYIKMNNKSPIETHIVTNKTENIGFKHYPKLYLSAEYKQKYPNRYLSPCGTKVLFSNNKQFIYPRICEFCNNIFPISKSSNIFKCRCGHYYCSICYIFSKYCSGNMELVYAASYKFFYFYCRWNCGQFYSGTDLIEHEDNCKENINARYSLRYLAEKHFTSYLNSTNKLESRSNVFSNQDFSRLPNNNIFVITRDNFKFVLHSSTKDKKLHFSVSHDYLPDKYHILFKIKSAEGEISRINTFSRDYKNNDVFGFTVLLQKNN